MICGSHLHPKEQQVQVTSNVRGLCVVSAPGRSACAVVCHSFAWPVQSARSVCSGCPVGLLEGEGGAMPWGKEDRHEAGWGSHALDGDLWWYYIHLQDLGEHQVVRVGSNDATGRELVQPGS